MVNVLVTGGAGFIGSHLVRALLKEGYRVAVFDNFSTGRRENVTAGAEIIEGDIRDFEAVKRALSGREYVFHAAALPRVQISIQDPKLTHEVNVGGTLNVLLASREEGVKRLVYSASSSAYGEQETLPLREDMPSQPLSPYGVQKYIGELYCRLFSKIYNLETISLRYFNVYGPGAPTEGAYALVIGKFLDARRKGEPLPIVPDGTQSRDFTHVTDVVAANLSAMRSSKVGKGEVINIGGGRNRSMLELAELIGGPRVFIEPRIEPKHTLADITRAKELLGWEPEVRFEEGIYELKKIWNLV